MADSAVPFPAATLVLLRDRVAGGVETLLIRRHAHSKFAAGDYVFAGGKIESDDIPSDVEQFCRGLTAKQAAISLGLASDHDALGYWVGAIREAFEEVGLLLAYAPTGEVVRFTDDNCDRFAAYRADCQASNRAFFTMLRAEGLQLATDRLVYFAHWITPEESPIRFDTRFFAAVAPAGLEATPDGREIVDAQWLTPDEALAAHRRRDISLRFPTIKNLEIIGAAAGAGTGVGAAEVVASLKGRDVPPIRPRLLTFDGTTVAVLPGDPRWY